MPEPAEREPERRQRQRLRRERDLWVNPPEPDRRRIRRELRKLWVDPPPFCRPGPSPVMDLLHWEVVIDGPDGTPYAGGTFPVDVDINCNYPCSSPPRLTFKTKVFHPNIDAQGAMVLDVFTDNWSAAHTIHSLLVSMVSVLYEPLLDWPVNSYAADLYSSDAGLYEAAAVAWTWEYSSMPVASYYPDKDDQPWLDYCEAVAAMCAADKAEERLRRRKAYERRRRRQEEEEKRLAAADEEKKIASRRGSGESLRWERVVAFLQGWSSAALPFATSRRRFYSALLPLSNYSGRACF